jgi:ABC-type glycerol-3-phosphate transport system substrate-binding protein
LHGLPIMGGNVLIYCNLDAFDRVSRHHGEPVRVPDGGWTLEEFVALCQLLTIDADGDGRIDQFGFLQPHWVYYLPFIWSHGARLLEQDPAGGYSLASRWALQGPEAVAALAMYADLRHRWGVTPMPIAYAGQNSDTAFLSGRVAMCVNGPWFQAFLRETALADRYCVVGIPRGPGGSTTRVTWDALCISAKTPAARQADAWQFVRFVLTSEAQEIFASHLRAIPARRSCAGAYTRYGGGVGSPSAVFIENMETARMQPITPAWQSMGRAIRRGFNSVLLDGESRVSAAAAIAALAADPEITGAFGSGG